MRTLFLVISVLLSFNVWAQTLAVAPYICDSAILQREKPIIIRGTANPYSEVVVAFDKTTLKTVASVSGEWSVDFPSKMASFSPLTLDVSSHGEHIRYSNILIGDIWFASGQSNMAFKVAGMKTQDRLKLIKEANYPNVRTYYRRNIVSGRKRVDDREDKKWSCARDSSILQWSAIAYLFARDLYEHYDIPVGIINCSHGASTAEAWISPKKFKSDPKLQQAISRRFSGIDSLFNNPSNLHLKMLSLFKGVPVKGVIWYQGEANGRYAQNYQYMFSNLIDDWREFFNDKNLPFIFAQLPSYRVGNDPTNESWAHLRWAQYQVAKDKDNSYMVVTADYGDPKDIHPKDKAPVAKRFFEVAQERVYAEKNLSFITLPEFASARSGRVEVAFDGVKGRLVAKSDIDIAVCAQDGVFKKCDAVLKNNKLIIDTKAIDNPKSVRYAWSNVNNLALYHINGTPVSPFELKIKDNE